MTLNAQTTITWLILTLIPACALTATLLLALVALGADALAGHWSWPRVGLTAALVAGLIAIRRMPRQRATTP